MKRLTLVFLILICALALASCTCGHELPDAWSYDTDSHSVACIKCGEVISSAAHRFGEPVVNEEEREVVTCSVCSYSTVLHKYSEEWTSDGEKHWHTCIDDGCAAVSAAQAHTLGDAVVLVAPTSESEGTVVRVCTVCQRGVTESTPRLPAKMSREAWESAFVFDNLKLVNHANVGVLAKVTSTIYVDGLNAMVEMDGSTSYAATADVLSGIDFSEHYDAFVHTGNGVYVARDITVTEDGLTQTYTSVEITFGDDGRISRISNQMDFGALFGIVSDEYILSDWGEVSVSVPKLMQELLISAVSADKYKGNFSLIKEIYSEDSYTATEIKVIGDIYTYEVRVGFEDEDITDSGYASSEGYAEQISAELLAILGNIDAEQLAYSGDGGYMLPSEIKNFAGSGKTLSSLSIMLEGERLVFLSYCIEGEEDVTYTFSGFNGSDEMEDL